MNLVNDQQSSLRCEVWCCRWWSVRCIRQAQQKTAVNLICKDTGRLLRVMKNVGKLSGKKGNDKKWKEKKKGRRER